MLNSVLVEGVDITISVLSNDILLIIYNGIFLKLWSEVLLYLLLFSLMSRQLESHISQFNQIGFDPFLR